MVQMVPNAAPANERLGERRATRFPLPMGNHFTAALAYPVFQSDLDQPGWYLPVQIRLLPVLLP